MTTLEKVQFVMMVIIDILGSINLYLDYDISKRKREERERHEEVNRMNQQAHNLIKENLYGDSD